jgi:hypothetical protein
MRSSILVFVPCPKTKTLEGKINKEQPENRQPLDYQIIRGAALADDIRYAPWV